MKVDVEFDGYALESNIKKRIETKVQAALDAEILKDSNFYCPQKEGVLQKSAIIHSVIGSGLLVWETPYARKQYYEHPYKSHNKNPHATMKWFETAKAKHKAKWENIANDEYHKNT